MSEWRTGLIGEFVDLSQGLAINAKSKHLIVSEGLPLLRITDMVHDNYSQFINESEAPVKCIATLDDVIYTRTGQVGLVYKNKIGVVHNNCFKVIPKDASITGDYLYWFLRQDRIIQYANSIASGSVQKDLNHGAFKSIPFNLPPLPEQKAIAKILGDLDDKIELNRKLNQTLEEMAQALFKSWFVDFDPVLDNAIAAGNEIPEALRVKAEKRSLVAEDKKLLIVHPELAEGFPNRFVFNEELGKWIPEGWEVKTIDDAATIVGGGTPSTKIEEYYCENGIPWMSPKDLSGYDWKYIGKGASDISELGLQKSSAKLMPKGSVLFSSRAPIGYIAIAENELCTNQGFKSLVPNKGIPTEYLFQFLKANTNEIESVATGSTFKEVSGSALKGLSIIIPDMKIVDEFIMKVDSSNKRCLIVQKQTETLTKLRDTLLPQLISGKLRVPEAMLKIQEATT